ncbi:SDR family NAD(P)-dependent oxidoreductase [Salinicoccus roseus]|uniref:SDR family NAD(P)-dependent oxidoreductase n=1 Tax=Salinicoccus roseus TaxID=45670 RepID=UPI000F4EA579|nr:SDR family NAD(P)-dependent oxidoreductase [Salinicoccus roseus]RPE51045.1 short-subunit dehydrogenase [Salinicoccus roseus]GGA78458.1 short-chain dehydrogenase/reductase [Salinicoccus roseus]
MAKVIWITGASSGFGMAVALQLLKQRKHVVCVSARRAHLLEMLVRKGAHAYPLDITETADIGKVQEAIEADHGPIDAVLVNAGFGVYGPIEEVPEEAVRRQFEVNVFGAVETVRSVLPSMRREKRGRIVLTSSSAAHVSSAGMGYYAATKHSIKAIGTALRQEVGELGIDVVMVEPGVVKTAFGQVALEENYMAPKVPDYQNQMDDLKTFMLKAFERAPEVDHTRDIMIKALIEEHVKPVYRTTRGSLALGFMSRLIPARMYDAIVKQAIGRLH